jgi:hypothetical protein
LLTRPFSLLPRVGRRYRSQVIVDSVDTFRCSHTPLWDIRPQGCTRFVFSHKKDCHVSQALYFCYRRQVDPHPPQDHSSWRFCTTLRPSFEVRFESGCTPCQVCPGYMPIHIDGRVLHPSGVCSPLQVTLQMQWVISRLGCFGLHVVFHHPCPGL